jgi:hypothetical protein
MVLAAKTAVKLVMLAVPASMKYSLSMTGCAI